MGGGVALAMMRDLGREQRLVNGLVLADTICYPQIPPWFILALRLPVIPSIIMRLIPERWGFILLKHAMYHSARGMNPEAIEEYADCLRSEGGHAALINVSRHMAPEDIDNFVRDYSSINVSTSLVWGKQDRVIPVRLGRRLASAIPDAQIHEIDRCGHVPQEEYPEIVAPLLAQFLNAVAQNSD